MPKLQRSRKLRGLLFGNTLYRHLMSVGLIRLHPSPSHAVEPSTALQGRPPVPVRKVAEYFIDRGLKRGRQFLHETKNTLTHAAHEVSDTLRATPGAVGTVISQKLDVLDTELTAAVMNAKGLTDISRLPNANKLATESTPRGELRVVARDLDETRPSASAPPSMNPGTLTMLLWADAQHGFAQADALRQAGKPLAARERELVQVMDTGLNFVPWLGGAYATGRLAYGVKNWVNRKVPFLRDAPNVFDWTALQVGKINSHFMPKAWGGGTALPKPVRTGHVPDTFEFLHAGGSTLGAATVASAVGQHDLNVYLNTDMAHVLLNASDAARNVTFVFGDLSVALWVTPLNARPPLLSGLDNHSNPYVFRDKSGFGYVDIPVLGTELGAGWRLGSSDYAIGTRFVLRPGSVHVPLSLERSDKEGPRDNKLVWRIGAFLMHSGFYPTAFVGPANYGRRETASMSQIRGITTRHGTTVGKQFENRNASQEVASINPAFGYGPIEAGRTPDYVLSPRRLLGLSD